MTSPYSPDFYFYCYGDHRDLHSFPTRRSSDLPSRPPRWPLFRLPPRTTAVIRAGTSAVPTVIMAGTGDRKSTRLNSSHSQISYAVFCLKKKKKIKTEHKPRRILTYTRTFRMRA